MKLSDCSYELPEAAIANFPPAIRGKSRLLVINRETSKIEDRLYSDIVGYLKSGDTLVLNDSKVIKARLVTKREDGASRELVILEKHGYDDNWHRHRVLYRKKLSVGDKLHIGHAFLSVEEIQGNGIAIVKSSHDLLELAEQYGQVPLPPYMHRAATSMDNDRYQTVWASKQGSVAAPTASLNMTDEVITTLKNNDINVVYITLHVGLGTFLPIRTDDVEAHKMHQEYFEISRTALNIINSTKNEGGRIVALGTTVARTLEYASDMLDADRDISGEANIFIYPGYEFKMVDCLITNFHAPKSTVLMLTAAFAGWQRLLPAYSHAVASGYKFLSYGDSMLIL